MDVSLGVFVFNKTSLPKNDCERYKSMADIEEGLLFRAKIGYYSILKYERDGESVAITLMDQTSTCGQKMYKTGLENVEVLLLQEHEKFMHAKQLETADMEAGLMFESQLRGALNTIELSMDIRK